MKNLIYDPVWGYRHRPAWKVGLNTLLRACQFWTKNPYTIVSEIENAVDGKPKRVVGYRFMRTNRNTRGEVL